MRLSDNYPDLVQPRHATPRHPGRRTLGGHVAAIAALRGRPLTPVQRYIADVANELDGDTGRLFYDTVVITVQRQVGKTDLDQNDSVMKAMMGRDRRAWYTAQTGQHANDHFLGFADHWDNMGEGNLLRRAAKKPRRSNGSMAMTFLNGSTWRPFPPTVDSQHGKQSDKTTVDEGWYHTLASGQALMQAIAPTMTTRSKLVGQTPQTWIMSAEGTVESTWLNPMLDEQRLRPGLLTHDRLEVDPDTTDRMRVCVFDWGLAADEDPTDLDVVASRHPGFGHVLDMPTLEREAVRFRDAPGEFARAYGNRRTGAGERIFPLEPWRAAMFEPELPEGRVCFGAAYGVDNVDATIVAAVREHDRIIVEVVAHRPGTTWCLPMLRDLVNRWGGSAAAVDRYGPSGALADEADRAGLDLVDINTSSVAAGASSILAWVTQPDPVYGSAWRWRPHDALDKAAEIATRRFVQDGAWTFGRRKTTGSISALEAANVATWGVDHMPEKVGMQLFVGGM